jgi:hypothetical protein
MDLKVSAPVRIYVSLLLDAAPVFQVRFVSLKSLLGAAVALTYPELMKFTPENVMQLKGAEYAG